jgi:hypothetical protein
LEFLEEVDLRDIERLGHGLHFREVVGRRGEQRGRVLESDDERGLDVQAKDGALRPVVAAHPQFGGPVLRPEQQHLRVQQAGRLLPALIGVGRDVFVVDVDPPALLGQGG